MEREPLPETQHVELLLSVTEAVEFLHSKDARAVDVRPHPDYFDGHLPDAVHFALSECDPEDLGCLRSRFGRLGLSGAEPVLIYGEPRDLASVARAFFLFEWAGFELVRILDASILDWQRAGHGVSVEATSFAPRDFDQATNTAVAADPRWVEAHYGLPGIELLDLRDEGIWMENGYEAPERFAQGHIPHALPYDFRPWLRNGLAEPHRGWLELRDLGPREWTYIRLASEFVVYGQDSMDPRPALAYLLLRRMGAPVRLFLAGWQGWVENPLNPVVRVIEAQELGQRLARENTGGAQGKTPRSFALLDLRELSDFATGHIPGAYGLPEQDFADKLETALSASWPELVREESPIALYCYGRKCIRSRDAANVAARMGFREIWWFRDGLEAWEQQGLPLASGSAGAHGGAPVRRAVIENGIVNWVSEG